MRHLPPANRMPTRVIKGGLQAFVLSDGQNTPPPLLDAIGNPLKKNLPPRERFNGSVKWYNEEKGYGFIERKDEPDLFVHGASLEKSGIDKLTMGQQVSFVIKKVKDQKRAIRIRIE